MRAAIFITILTCILTLPWLGKDFYSRGEPREALVAQSMLTSGNWLVGSGYGGVVPSKPPFTHWLMALSSYLSGGLNEYATRLPAALAIIFFSFYLTQFLSKRYGQEFALLASAMLLLSAEWFRAGISARVDTVLSVSLAAAFLSFFEACEGGFKRYPLLLPVFVCVATLTKGPVALLLSAGVFGVYLLVERRPLVEVVRKLMLLLIPAVFLSGLWYFAGSTEAGERFAAKFYYENIARFASTMEDEPHRHSVLYLYGTIFLGLLPWTLLFLPTLAGKILQWWRAKLSLRGFDAFERFALCAILVPVVFYSIPSSKRSVYLLPIYPFLIFFVARVCMQLNAAGKRWISRGTLMVSLLSLVLIIFLTLSAIGLVTLPGLPSNLNILTPTYFLSGAALGVVAICLVGKAILSKQSYQDRIGIKHFLVLFFLLGLMLNAALFPAFSRALSPKKFVAAIKNEVDKADRILSYGYEFYGISFYLNRRIDRVKDSLRAGDLVLLYENDLKSFNEKFGERFQIKVVDRSDYGIEKANGFVNLLRLEEKA